MLFDNGHLLLFLPIFLVLYYACPKNWQRYILLAGSLLYAYCQNVETICGIVLFVLILFVYTNISRYLCNRKKERLLISIFTVLLMISIMLLARLWQLAVLGLSFYALRCIAFVVDCNKENECETNALNLLLFVAYFPILPAGPIEKSNVLLKELNESNYRRFDPDRAYKGFIYMLIGLFMKCVLADRSAVIVDAVYGSYEEIAGSLCLVGVLLYSIQIYCDFAGYSIMAKGISEMLGISISDNFCHPYLAGNVRDFWKRWHISLSTWLKEYVYIPLGGNKRGFLRKELNLLITFAVSGFWHGFGMQYIVWGCLHGIYRMFEDLVDHIRGYNRRKDKVVFRIIKCIFTFLLITFAWIFFRANDVNQAVSIIRRIIFDFQIDSLNVEGLISLGWGRLQMCGILVACVILFLADVLCDKGIICWSRFLQMSKAKRCIICYSMMLWIAISVIQLYGIGQEVGFIYAKF